MLDNPPYPEVVNRLYPCIVNVLEILLQVTLGRKAKALIENARRSIAKELSVKAKEIVFTIRNGGKQLGYKTCCGSSRCSTGNHLRIEHKCVARP